MLEFEPFSPIGRLQELEMGKCGTDEAERCRSIGIIDQYTWYCEKKKSYLIYKM